MTRSSPFTLRYHRAIVAGYGLVGRFIADELEQAGLDVTIIETNLETVEKQLHLDRSCFFGDICDRQTLEEIGLLHADALILAIPDEQTALKACKIAREINPELFIAARTNFMSRGLLAQQFGADAVVVEEVVTAQAMRQAVMDAMGPLT